MKSITFSKQKLIKISFNDFGILSIHHLFQIILLFKILEKPTLH